MKSNIIKIWNGFQSKQELDTAVDAVRHSLKTDRVQVTLINAGVNAGMVRYVVNENDAYLRDSETFAHELLLPYLFHLRNHMEDVMDLVESLGTEYED